MKILKEKQNFPNLQMCSILRRHRLTRIVIVRYKLKLLISFAFTKILFFFCVLSQYKLIRTKDVDLAEIYSFGTTSDVENRITADQLVAWFRKNVSLKARWSSFEPKPMPTSIMPGKDLCDHIVEG